MELAHKPPVSLDTLCQHYIEQHYLNPPKDILRYPVIHSNPYSKASYAYGQIYYQSLKKIYSQLSINIDDVIVELGSGIGKTVLQLLLRTPAKKVIGIEIDQQKYQFAKNKQTQIEKELAEYLDGAQKQLEFIYGDFIEQSLSEATVIFTDSTCFSNAIVELLRVKLPTLEHLHSIVSLKHIPALVGFHCIKRLSVECSWGTGRCFIYQRKDKYGTTTT